MWKPPMKGHLKLHLQSLYYKDKICRAANRQKLILLFTKPELLENGNFWKRSGDRNIIKNLRNFFPIEKKTKNITAGNYT